MTEKENIDKNEKIEGVEFFWKIIDKKPGKNFRTITNSEELKILEKNKIIELSTDRWLTYKDNLLHFLNLEKKIFLSPGHFDIMTYVIFFGKLIGNEVAYKLIEDRIFHICDQQIHDKDNVNKLDDIICELKNGVYGKIDESKFWFIDIYPYVVSNTFFLRDVVAREKAKAISIEYDDNYGGRCVSLLSIKKVLIDNVSIHESIIDYEEKRLGTHNLKIIMEKNRISHNECLSKNTKKNKTVDEYWQ